MKKKIIFYAILGIIFVFIITICIHIKDKKNLNNWIGEYYYIETFPHNSGQITYFIEYTIIIYKEENKYYAQITGDGWFTMTRMLAQVTGDQNKIDIAYLQATPGDLSYGSYEAFDKGEVLWQFERNGSDINTIWKSGKEFHPTLIEMEGEIMGKYFAKIAVTEK